MTILFRTAAGPRIGFGHLVRAGVLRRALRARAALSLRGGSIARRAARRMGWRVTPASPAHLRHGRTRLLVIDDPSAAAARPWVRAARRHRVPVASVHDLGMAPVPSDLAIDGSVATRTWLPAEPGEKGFSSRRFPQVPSAGRNGDAQRLVGTRYSVVDPRFAKARWRPSKRRRIVLIALGGGPHARLADAIASAILDRAPEVRVRIAGGLTRTDQGLTRADQGRPLRMRADQGRTRRTQTVVAPGGLARELASCSAAIVGGGVTLYEACALGVPTVAVPIVPAQLPTVRAFARRKATLRGGNGFGRMPSIDRTVDMVLRALTTTESRRLSTAGRSIVDGRGAIRVARALRALAHKHEARWHRRTRHTHRGTVAAAPGGRR